MAEKEPKLLQEYDDGIVIAAKYCNNAQEKRTKPGSKPHDDGAPGAGVQ